MRAALSGPTVVECPASKESLSPGPDQLDLTRPSSASRLVKKEVLPVDIVENAVLSPDRKDQQDTSVTPTKGHRFWERLAKSGAEGAPG